MVGYPHLIIIVAGLPASGKSTIINRLKDSWESELAIVSNDNIGYKLGSKWNDLKFRFQVYEKATKLTKELLNTHSDIAIDATFARPKFRNIFFKELTNEDLHFTLINVETSLDICRSRIIKRISTDPLGKTGMANLDRFDKHVQIRDPILYKHLPLPSSYIRIESSYWPPRILEMSNFVPERLKNAVKNIVTVNKLSY